MWLAHQQTLHDEDADANQFWIRKVDPKLCKTCMINEGSICKTFASNQRWYNDSLLCSRRRSIYRRKLVQCPAWEFSELISWSGLSKSHIWESYWLLDWQIIKKIIVIIDPYSITSYPNCNIYCFDWNKVHIFYCIAAFIWIFNLIMFINLFPCHHRPLSSSRPSLSCRSSSSLLLCLYFSM